MLQAILNRKSVREFKPDSIIDEQITEIIKAGQFAPSARNNKSVEFIVIKNQETKDKIFEIVGQETMKSAPVLIVPTIDSVKSMCPIQDLSVVSENIFLQAAEMGLGTVWKALKGELPEEEKIKEILKIPEQYKVINLIPLGYPSTQNKPHIDAEFSAEKIHQEHW